MRVWWVSGVVAAAVLASPVRAADPPSLSAFAADPAISDADVAPDGRNVAYIGRLQGRRGALVMAADGAVSTAIAEGGAEIAGLKFLDPQHLLVFSTATIPGGMLLPKQNLIQGSLFNLATRKAVTLLQNTPDTLPIISGGSILSGQRFQGTPTVFVKGLRGDPAYDLFRIDLDTGRGTVVDPGSIESAEWVVAGDGRLVAKTSYDPSSRRWMLFTRKGSGWRTVRNEIAPEPLRLIGLGRSEERLLVRSPAGLAELVAETGQPAPSPLALTTTAARSPIYDPQTTLLVAVRLDGPVPRYIFYDARLEAAWAKVTRAFPGKVVRLQAFDGGRQNLVVDADSPTDPGAFYWVDLKTGHADVIERKYEDLKPEQLGTVRMIDFRAADGLPLTAKLMLPPGRGPTNLPLIVAVHEPGSQAGFGFDPINEALASRGYAVLRVNNRGSAGGGPELLKAGEGQLGRAILTDLSDAVAALARQGVINPARVCIWGMGWGGFTALAGVTVQKGIYRCAIAVNAVSDLASELQLPSSDTFGPVWSRVQSARRLVGSDKTRSPQVLAISPLAQAAAASAPVLLIHGADDTIVEPEQAQRMHAALERAGKPSELVVIKGASHGLSQPAHREQMLEAALKFMARANPPDR